MHSRILKEEGLGDRERVNYWLYSTNGMDRVGFVSQKIFGSRSGHRPKYEEVFWQ